MWRQRAAGERGTRRSSSLSNNVTLCAILGTTFRSHDVPNWPAFERQDFGGPPNAQPLSTVTDHVWTLCVLTEHHAGVGPTPPQLTTGPTISHMHFAASDNLVVNANARTLSPAPTAWRSSCRFSSHSANSDGTNVGTGGIPPAPSTLCLTRGLSVIRLPWSSATWARIRTISASLSGAAMLTSAEIGPDAANAFLQGVSRCDR